MTTTRQRERSHLFDNAASQNRVQARATVSDNPVCALTHTPPHPVARNTSGRVNSGVGEAMERKERNKVCKPPVDSFSANLPPPSRAPGFSKQDCPPGLPWTGQSRGDHPLGSPVWQPHRRCWLYSPALPAAAGEWAGSPPPAPRPSQRGGPLRFLEEKNAGRLGGRLRSCFPPNDGPPGSSCLPRSVPSLGRSQQQSLLKKMLVMATARANSIRLELASSPQQRGRGKGRSESWAGGGAWREARPPLHC